MKNVLYGSIYYFLTGCFLFLLLSGCASLPSRPELPHEAARPPAVSGSLAEFLEEIMAPENGYRLFRTDENKIRWQARDNILTGQPSRGLIQSLGELKEKNSVCGKLIAVMEVFI